MPRFTLSVIAICHFWLQDTIAALPKNFRNSLQLSRCSSILYDGAESCTTASSTRFYHIVEKKPWTGPPSILQNISTSIKYPPSPEIQWYCWFSFGFVFLNIFGSYRNDFAVVRSSVLFCATFAIIYFMTSCRCTFLTQVLHAFSA